MLFRSQIVDALSTIVFKDFAYNRGNAMTVKLKDLIPYNEVKEMPFKRSNRDRVHRFMSYLKQHGINVTVRKEFGTDIDAACGQLRAKNEGVIK